MGTYIEINIPVSELKWFRPGVPAANGMRGGCELRSMSINFINCENIIPTDMLMCAMCLSIFLPAKIRIGCHVFRSHLLTATRLPRHSPERLNQAHLFTVFLSPHCFLSNKLDLLLLLMMMSVAVIAFGYFLSLLFCIIHINVFLAIMA